jgi:hypothetical protein
MGSFLGCSFPGWLLGVLSAWCRVHVEHPERSEEERRGGGWSGSEDVIAVRYHVPAIAFRTAQPTHRVYPAVVAAHMFRR